MSRPFHLVSLVPLGFAALQLVWGFCVLIAVAQAGGKLSQTRAQTHALDLIAMIPGVIGIIVAVCVSFRLPLSVLDRVVVTIGVVACLPLLIAFGREFMTP